MCKLSTYSRKHRLLPSIPSPEVQKQRSTEHPLPLACRHLPKGTKLELGRGAHLGTPSSTDWLSREDSQLAASLEGELGPTSSGKTLPHSYPETRFRRERAQDTLLVETFEDFLPVVCYFIFVRTWRYSYVFLFTVSV